jgi:phosphate transport system substrate-binding protein
VLVQGISNDELALGFLPFAYFEENAATLKLIPVDDGKGGGPITPTPDTIEKGTYRPLSRPVFIYVSKQAAARPEVRRFVEFYLQNADTLVREVNYVSLGATSYRSSVDKLAKELAQ